MSSTKVMSFELNGVQIKTTVTNDIKVLDEHISSFLHPTNNYGTKVIGFDTEWRPPVMKEPATFQLCDGNSCLIFHLHPQNPVPLSLRNFLRQPNYTFVGCGIKDDFDYLKKLSGIGCKNAVELGTLAATLMDNHYLSFCGIDELAFVVNKLDLRKYRPLNLAFNWGDFPVSEELAKLATVNAYSYHKIGSALFESYRPQSQSSTVANVPSLAVDGGISDCVVSEIVGTKTPYSAATANEDLLAIASGTLSATSESMPSSVEQCGKSKAELEEWENAADISTPKLEVSDKTQQHRNGRAVTDIKYSRDLLLKFSEQCSELPEGFEITADIADALMSLNIGSRVIVRDTPPSPGRNADRSGGISRMDCRGSGVIVNDKWNKVPGAFHSGMCLDGSGGNTEFRPGQGINFGVLMIPCPQGVMQRNSPDGDRWQCAANFPQRQTMHKAEKKYEVGKVTDEEQLKQRQLKGILNKLHPQNFEKLFEQVKAVNIDNVVTLTGVISQIFEKALMEPTFCEMYANLCFHLAAALPDLSQDNEKITFKRLLLKKCQEEYERGEREQEEANKADEGELKQSDEEREAKRSKARRRKLGNIRLIGELYKKRIMPKRIMHACIQELLDQCQNLDEEDIEALCTLMSTIGEMIDRPKAKKLMDVYFERIKLLKKNMNLSSRVRFMLKDTIDLRKNRWQQRRKVEDSKKIEEVHRDASQQRQSQAGRLGRGMGISTPRRTPMDFGSRGSSMLSPPNAQMGGLLNQICRYGSQDASQERQS